MAKRGRIQTPAEEKILDDIAAAEARGEDPFGDDEDLVPETIEDQAAADQAELDEQDPPPADPPPAPPKRAKKAKAAAAKEPAAEEPPADEDTTPDDDVAALAKAAGIEDVTTGGPEEDDDGLDPEDDDDLDPEDDDTDLSAKAEEPILPPIDVAKLDTDRKALRAERAEAHRKLMDGEIDPKAYSDLIEPIENKLEEIADQRAIAVVEERNRAAAWKASINNVIAEAKKAGSIDYVADTDAQVEFDAAWRSIAASSKVPLSAAQLHQKAHATVLAMRGIGKAQKSAAKAPDPKTVTPPPRAATQPPVTLRKMPSASVPNAGGDAKTALARLPGDKFQAAFSKLTQAQKDALTSTDD